MVEPAAAPESAPAFNPFASFFSDAAAKASPTSDVEAGAATALLAGHPPTLAQNGRMPSRAPSAKHFDTSQRYSCRKWLAPWRRGSRLG